MRALIESATLKDVVRKNLMAFTGLALFEKSEYEAIGLGALISILFSLPNYTYNFYLDVGEKIAEAFAKKVNESEDSNNKTLYRTIALTITPTKGAMLAAIVGTPILLYVGQELLDENEFIIKVAGGVLVTTAVLSFGMAVAGMIVPDVLASLADVQKELEKKFKCGESENNKKVVCDIQESIWLAEKPLSITKLAKALGA